MDLREPRVIVKKTGTSLKFSEDAIYGSETVPETGNFLLDSSNLQFGVTILVIHNTGAEPFYPIQFFKSTGSGSYVPGVNNYFVFVALSTTKIMYTINQTI